MKPHGKSIVSSDNDEKVIFFKDLSLGPHEAQLRFRLIHFLEAWNPLKKTLIGMEMLLIDEQVIVITRFFIISKEVYAYRSSLTYIGFSYIVIRRELLFKDSFPQGVSKNIGLR